jgi:translation elongation factor aEF-1 beta
MAEVLVLMRIFPEDPEADMGKILEDLKSRLPGEVKVRDHRAEEMGFGLRSLLVAFTMPDREGVGEELEQTVRGVGGVSEINVERVTRIL